ncbi:MAG: 6-phosphofructokinase [Patescibacteria group bacterium]|jgi:6-phosphofructokinase 1
MLNNKTILVFTGGGVSPALNPTVYGVVKAAKAAGMRILGGISGWACLLDNGKIIDLTDFDLAMIKNNGGALLRSSRTNPFNAPDGLEQIKLKIKEQKIDYIVAIGGDDTLGAARRLFETAGLKIVGVPKTVDNDLAGTYWSPGYPTAAANFSRITENIKKDAAHPLSRIFVIESIGGHAGWVAAAGAYGQADLILPAEREINLTKFLSALSQKYEANGNFAVVAVAQNAHFDAKLESITDDQADDYQVKRQYFVSIALRDVIKKTLNVNTRVVYPANILQSGPASNIDREISIKLGEKSVALLEAEKFGQMACVLRPDPQSLTIEIGSVDLAVAVGKENYRAFPDEYFDWDNFQPTEKFFDYMEPILGKYQPEKDDPYYQLIKQINA